MLDKVNRKILERGRGVPNAVFKMRQDIKYQTLKILKTALEEGNIKELEPNLVNLSTELTDKYGPPAIGHIRACLGFDPALKTIKPEELNQVLNNSKVVNGKIVNIIESACHKCTNDKVTVFSGCQKCVAHPCSIVCPVDCIWVDPEHKKITVIDSSKCIRCEQCIKVCPYEAIIHEWRPCSNSCGVEAIKRKEDGFPTIDGDECVSCGLCTIACPFGAIAHKSELASVLVKLSNSKRHKKLAAIVAPAFVNQFSTTATPGDIFEAIRRCGFDSVTEVAYGADMDTVEIAERVASKEKDEWVGTSCCPAWVKTVDTKAPSLRKNVTESFAPMTETAQSMKKADPHIDVVFIGPCVAKIAETLQTRVRPLVEHAITFEEMEILFKLMNVTIKKKGKKLNQASSFGRGYANAKGVAAAVKKAAEEKFNIKDLKAVNADGLLRCREMLGKLERGEIKADIVEGMGCPGGCVGGAGILAPIQKTKVKVAKFQKEAKLTLDEAVKQSYEQLVQ